MLKLIRINNSTTGVPQEIECPIRSGISFRLNRIYCLDGSLTDEIKIGKPLFVTLQSKGAVIPGNEEPIKCFRVVSGMEFEATCDPEKIYDMRVGVLVGISQNEDDQFVTPSSDAEFIITEVLGEGDNTTVKILVI